MNNKNNTKIYISLQLENRLNEIVYISFMDMVKRPAESQVHSIIGAKNNKIIIKIIWPSWQNSEILILTVDQSVGLFLKVLFDCFAFIDTL